MVSCGSWFCPVSGMWTVDCFFGFWICLLLGLISWFPPPPTIGRVSLPSPLINITELKAWSVGLHLGPKLCPSVFSGIRLDTGSITGLYNYCINTVYTYIVMECFVIFKYGLCFFLFLFAQCPLSIYLYR